MGKACAAVKETTGSHGSQWMSLLRLPLASSEIVRQRPFPAKQGGTLHTDQMTPTHMMPPCLSLGRRRSCYFRSRCCCRCNRHRGCCGSCGCRRGGGSRRQRGRDEGGSLRFGARLSLGRFGLAACLRCFGRLQELRELGLAGLLRHLRGRFLGGLPGGVCLCPLGGLGVHDRLASRGFGAGCGSCLSCLLGDPGFGLQSDDFHDIKGTAAGRWSLASDFLLSSSCQSNRS